MVSHHLTFGSAGIVRAFDIELSGALPPGSVGSDERCFRRDLHVNPGDLNDRAPVTEAVNYSMKLYRNWFRKKTRTDSMREGSWSVSAD